MASIPQYADEGAILDEIAEMNEQLAWAERVLAAKETTLVHLLAQSLADTTRRLISVLNETEQIDTDYDPSRDM